MNQLTHNLDQMIHHQRQAEQWPAGSEERERCHREAMRYRAEAYRLERQQKVIRWMVREWVREN